MREIDIGSRDDLVDHPLQAEPLPVLGRKDPRDAIVVQFLDLRRDDHPAAAAEYLDMLAAAFAQQIKHVFEELDMTALIRRDRDRVHVLLQRARHDLFDRAVMAEMDDFAARRLQNPAHDVYRRVVTIEQARGGREAHLMQWPIDKGRSGRVVHRINGRQRAALQRREEIIRSSVAADENATLYDVYVNVNAAAEDMLLRARNL